MAKAKATVEEMVGMIDRGELRLAKDHGVPIRQSYIRVNCLALRASSRLRYLPRAISYLGVLK